MSGERIWSLLPVLVLAHISQNLWNLGRVMNIPRFDDNNLHEEMSRAMAKAQRDDRSKREERQKCQPERPLGQNEGGTPSRVQIESVRYMLKMREMFQGNTIRRMPESKDWEGKPILHLKPSRQIELLLKLEEREMGPIKERIGSMTCSSVTGRYSSKVEVSQSQVALNPHIADCNSP